MKKRRTKEELIEDIRHYLAVESLSINDLAEKLESNWSTVRDILQFMENLDLVESEKGTERFKLYKMKTRPKKREDTFFGVPLSRKDEKTLHHLFSRIKQIFLENMDRPPKDTEMQKIAVDVALECNLNVPMGWYLFGLITVMRYDETRDYPQTSIDCEPGKLDSEILKFIEYYRVKYTRELVKKQYEKFGNKLYLAKEELRKLGHERLDLNNIENKKAVQKLLSTFLFYLPTKEDSKEIVEIATNYVNIMNKLLISKINLNDLKSDLVDAFEATWRCIATYYFFETICETKKYDRVVLYDNFFKLPLEDRKEIAIEYINHLENLLPEETEIPVLKIEKVEAVDLIKKSYEEMAKDTE